MKPINPNQIFDFAALESKLKAAETAFAQYSANSSKAIDVLNKRIESTKDEIKELICDFLYLYQII